MKKNERLQALNLLIKVIVMKTPLLNLMKPSANLSPLSKELCFGICRHYYRLEALADLLVKKRPKQMDVWICLLMGLYQLHYLRIPDYAVVKETVGLLMLIKKPWAKGLVNAVLRSYCRDEANLLTSLNDNPTFVYGHPQWLVERIQRSWPDDWQAILLANDQHPPMSLRVNARHQSTTDYLSKLEQVEIKAQRHQFSPTGLLLEKPCDVYDLPGFELGDVSVQDQAAQLAVSLLELKPQLRVLDACCAPGGKTCHILETSADLTSVLALDIEESRLTRVQDNLNRLNLKATLIKGDALKPESWWDGIPFDRILLDAPCSATGVIRRHPDIKLLRLESDISAVSQLQSQLLRSLWPLLAKDGILVYATCSIMPEENHQQIAKFIVEINDCQIEETPKPWGKWTGLGWQILPGDNQMDGFFYSVLRKK